METVELLWNLQAIEEEWEKIKNLQRKTNLANNSLKMKNQVEELANSIQFQRTEIVESQTMVKAADLELQGLTVEKKEIEAKLYSGELTQVKEMEHWQEKLNNHALAIQSKEERIVNLMEQLEEAERKLQDSCHLLEEKQQNWQNQEEKNRALEDKILKRLTFLKQKKKRIIASLGQEIINRYEHSKKRFGLGAIARLKGSVCQGCYMALPTGIIQAISLKPGLHTCENCGRILYINQIQE